MRTVCQGIGADMYELLRAAPESVYTNLNPAQLEALTSNTVHAAAGPCA